MFITTYLDLQFACAVSNIPSLWLVRWMRDASPNPLTSFSAPGPFPEIQIKNRLIKSTEKINSACMKPLTDKIPYFAISTAQVSFSYLSLIHQWM